eukprot:12274647-Prorocentrum_lima.AAC.1
MQELQDTENKIAKEQPHLFDDVANLQAEDELQDAAQLLQDTREEEIHQNDMVYMLQNTVSELTDDM